MLSLPTKAPKENLFSFLIKQIPDLRQVRLFGLVMAINFPLYWVIWHGQSHDHLDIVLRLIACFLCVGLIIYTYYSIFCPKLYAVYWYGVVTFCLPFFFAFMTLKNHGSALWFMNCMSALFFNLMIMPVSIFFLISIVGILMAAIFFYFFLPPFYFDLGTIDLYGLFWTFFGAVVIGGLFAHRRDQVQREKLQTLKSFGSTLAHELQWPLDMMRHLTGDLEALLKNYVGTDKSLSEKDGDFMVEFVEDVGLLADRARYTVDSVLSNVRENLDDMEKETLSVRDCLNDALESYPFIGDEEDYIKIIPNGDFELFGNGDLMQHIFLNLIHNSIYFINKSGRGEIVIEIKPGTLENTVIFKDTSVGIRPEFLPEMFEPFQSDRPHGTGIGLSFCRRAVEAMGGTITCESVLGKHTTFTLTFRG